MPRRVALDAGLRSGDRLRARVAGPGRILLERIEPQPELTTPSGPAPEEAA
jgi:hypothetical protein